MNPGVGVVIAVRSGVIRVRILLFLFAIAKVAVFVKQAVPIRSLIHHTTTAVVMYRLSTITTIVVM